MSQLHHDPVLDEAAVPAPGSGTPLDGPRESPLRRADAAGAEVPPTSPAQTAGDTARRGDAGDAPAPDGRSVSSRAVAAARTAGRATVRAGSRSVIGARAAARRVRPIGAAPEPDAHLAGADDLAGLSGLAEATARAGLDEVAARGPVVPVEDAVADAAVATTADDAAEADAVTTTDESDTATDEAGAERCSVPVVVAGHGRHRAALARRRPAVFLAAALVTAAGLGVLTGGETEAQAQAEPAPPVSESVSVARALGIEGTTPAVPVPVEAEAAQLAELASSRADRDLERFAAAVAQSEADQLTQLAIAEAARPDAVLPVQGARLTSGFGARWGTLHAGIDLAAPMLTPEYAAMDGVVLEAGPASGYGNAVYIQHENGDVTVYGHMETILVEAGQVVRAGDTIALLGNRGQSTGPHLHFEVHVGGLNGTKVDPIPWLRERGVQI